MSWELKLKNPQTDRQKKSPQHRGKDKELECSKESGNKPVVSHIQLFKRHSGGLKGKGTGKPPPAGEDEEKGIKHNLPAAKKTGYVQEKNKGGKAPG